MSGELPPIGGSTEIAKPGLGDLSTASQFRDIMTTHIQKKTKDMLSKAKKGRVVSVDFLAFTAQVWFAGDAAPTTVNIISSTVPGQWGNKFGRDTSDDTGQVGAGSTVLVEEFFNKLYITEVLTGGQFSIDYSMAGSRQQAFGLDSQPEYVRAAEYVYTTEWNYLEIGENGGGPNAINIGPFLLADTTDIATSEAFDGNNGNGAWEIDVISGEAGGATFEIGTWPTELLATIYPTGDAGYNGSYDIWYRLIPSRYNFDAIGKAFFQSINPSSGCKGSINTWDNSFDTSTAVSRSTSIPNPEDPTNASLGLLKFQATTVHTPMQVGAGINTRTPVVANAEFQGQINLYATVTTTGCIIGVRWYTSANAFISTAASTSTTVTANTWTQINTIQTAPSNASFASFFIQVGSSPATSTIFYADNFIWTINDSLMMPSYTVDIAHRQTIHGSPDSDPKNSAGELWMRIYMDWLTPLNDDGGTTGGSTYQPTLAGPRFIVRVRNTGAFSTARSTKTGLPVYEYDTNPVAPRGVYGYHDGNTGITSNPLAGLNGTPPGFLPSSGTWRNPELLTGTRAAQSVTGGTPISFKVGGAGGRRVKWTAALEFCWGRSRRTMPLGYYTLAFPSTGAFIPVFPGKWDGITSVTVDADGIPLTSSQSLWLYMPPGLTSASIPTGTYYNPATFDKAGGLFIIDPHNDPGYWVPPEHAVMLAKVNNAGNQMRFIDGNYYGGNFAIGDSTTAISIPGTLDIGDEVFGNATVTAGVGATAPFGQTTVSYSALSGTGAIVPTLGVNTTAPGTTVPGASYTSAASTSTIIVLNRGNNTATTVSYRIKRIP